MSKGNKIYNKVMLLILLLFFFLPFVTVSCENQDVAKLNGSDFITGTVIDGKDVAVSVPLFIVLIIVVVTLTYLFFSNRLKVVHIIISNVFILFSLMFFIKDINDRADKFGYGIKYNIGFWLMLLTTLGNIGYNGYIYIKKKLKYKAYFDDVSVKIVD